MKYEYIVLVYSNKRFRKKLLYLYGTENLKNVIEIFKKYDSKKYYCYDIKLTDCHKNAKYNKIIDILFDNKELNEIFKR